MASADAAAAKPASAANHFDTLDRVFRASTTPAMVALRLVTPVSLLPLFRSA
jgi:hypothetical protein